MNLFSQILESPETEIAKISGLQYVENYLTRQEHDEILNAIDAAQWINDIKRRVQHYGFKYDYKARRIDYSMKIGDLPEWAQKVAVRLYRDGYFDVIPDQVIVNEYMPGQGITPHIDCEPCFEDTLISISLGSYCVMDFGKKLSSEKVPVLLAPRSIVILKGESRYTWTHGIAPRKTDVYHDMKIERRRRISLTFRKTIIK